MGLQAIDLIPEFAFWRDGCRSLGLAISAALHAAGEPVTKANILVFVRSLPYRPSDLTKEYWQKGYCGTCLAKAQDNLPAEDSGQLMDYFLSYFTDRSYVSQMMLIDAFIGILEGIREEGGPCPTTAKS